jgi:hypothetical protein
MRKPNYNMERKDRERAKQAKAAAKVENRAVKGDQSRQSDVSTSGDVVDTGETEGQKSNG